jgi:hypothetical protein
VQLAVGNVQFVVGKLQLAVGSWQFAKHNLCVNSASFLLCGEMQLAMCSLQLAK